MNDILFSRGRFSDICDTSFVCTAPYHCKHDDRSMELEAASPRFKEILFQFHRIPIPIGIATVPHFGS